MTLQKIKTVEKAAHNAVYTYLRITLFIYAVSGFQFLRYVKENLFWAFFFLNLIFWFIIIISVFIIRDF